MTRSVKLAVLGVGILLGLPGSSRAAYTTILDQIGPNPSFVQSGNAYTDQIFGAPYNKDNIAVIDNFSITQANTRLVEVDAAVLGFGAFTAGDFKNITAVRVEIYSSVAAAASSLTGDVADINVKAADIDFTTPYGTDKFSALAQLGIDVTLGVGNYYIAVIPSLSFSNTGGAEIGVYASTYGGDSNAYQVNPGGGFGFAGNTTSLGVNAAYRILSVPEPSSMLILSTGLALAAYRSRRARSSRS